MTTPPTGASPAPALLQALAGQRPERTPVWFMRQAGRSLPEYRALRRAADLPMLEVCLTPALAAEATLQPVRRHGVDAAVLFSDIMVPLRLAGVEVEIVPGVGPVLATPVRTADDVARLARHRLGEGTWTDAAGGVHEAADGVRAVARAVELVLSELGRPGAAGRLTEAPPVGVGICRGARPGGLEGLDESDRPRGTSEAACLAAGSPTRPTLGTQATGTGDHAAGSRWSPSDRERAEAGLAQSRGKAGWTPLIGFGGAPFTLAAYLVEGRPSRDHLAARTLMHADPAAWDTLMTWCASLTGDFMATQVRAGASAAQLFDSWAGALSPANYREHVAPYSALALGRVGEAVSGVTGRPVPVIHFGTGTARLLRDMRATGADAVGVDDRTDLAWAIAQLGGGTGGMADGAGGSATNDTAGGSGERGPCPVQGNLDPALLAAPWEVLAAGIDACMEAGRTAPGHVVNLGHGVPPATDPDVLTRVVARVHGSQAWEQGAQAGWSGAAARDVTEGTTIPPLPTAGKEQA